MLTHHEMEKERIMTTSNVSSRLACLPDDPPSRRRRTLGSLVAAAFAAWRQRRALATLDDHRLTDLGLDPEDVAREVRRPIWDVPAGWRR